MILSDLADNIPTQQSGLKLRNKTRAASKIGYLVKAVRGGFVYAGAGDTPVGVVTEIVPAGSICAIQTEGRTRVYAAETITAGVELRMPVEDEGGQAGQVYNVGDESSYVSIGHSITHGRGLIEVSLNISASGGSSGVSSHLLLTDIGVNTHAQIDVFIASGAYTSWNYEYDTVTPQSVAITNGLSFGLVPGTDIGFSWDGANRRQTINYTGTPGSMDDWYMAVDYDPGLPVTHAIANHTIVDFQGGTYIDAVYTFAAPVHGVAFSINTTAFNADYYTRTLADSTFTTESWVNSNFDDYGGWNYEYDTVTPQSVNITSGLSFGLVPGTDIGFSWDGANRRQTINYTGTPGSMDDWYFVVDGGASHTIANHGIVDFQGGTGITLTYTFVAGVHGVSIASSVVSSQWTTDTYGITYANHVGIGAASHSGYHLYALGTSYLSGNTKVGGTLEVTSSMTATTVTSSGSVIADTYFRSSDTSVIIGPATSGTVYIRPSGYSASSLQSYWSTTLHYVGTNMTIAQDLTITGGAACLTLKATATDDHVYMQWYADSGALSTRSMYMGYAAAGTHDWTMKNEFSDGDIRIYPGSTSGHVFLQDSGGVKLTTYSGGIAITGSVLASGEVESYDTSDIRFKDIKEELNDVKITNDLMGLRTIRYRHKKKDKMEVGLIAQEVQAILPENVKKNDEGYLMIHYGRMIAPLLAMNKHQERRILELERKVARY